jgi:hypothetical protein
MGALSYFEVIAMVDEPFIIAWMNELVASKVVNLSEVLIVGEKWS